mmetsp:Transcript_74989/g.132442  ORF Transcript_74989/g.132442 Transcript_74989/m.132442 type:complete len:158 (+) Transcript_74989:614-1087(+)
MCQDPMSALTLLFVLRYSPVPLPMQEGKILRFLLCSCLTLNPILTHLLLHVAPILQTTLQVPVASSLSKPHIATHTPQLGTLRDATAQLGSVTTREHNRHPMALCTDRGQSRLDWLETTLRGLHAINLLLYFVAPPTIPLTPQPRPTCACSMAWARG